MSKYFIGSETLKDYCERNDLDYHYYRNRIRLNLQKNPNADLDQMLKHLPIKTKNKTPKLINNSKKSKIYYQGIPLIEYCRLHDCSYNSIITFITRLKEKEPNIFIEDAIYLAITSIKKNGIKYYYQNVPLTIYCQNKKLNVKYVRAKIKSLMLKGYSKEEAILEAVKYYERKNYWHKVNEIFNFLNTNQNISDSQLNKILEYLNIDLDNYTILKSKLGVFRAINIIWYFHDNKSGKLKISSSKFTEIMQIYDTLNEEDLSKVRLSLLPLLGLYKTKLFDTRCLIILNFIKYIRSLISYYSLELDVACDGYLKEEIMDSAVMFLLELIENNYNNQEDEIINYMIKSLKGFVINYLKSYKDETMHILSYDNLLKSR